MQYVQCIACKYQLPVSPVLQMKEKKVPFCCKECGSLLFSHKATRDIVFVFPTPVPEKLGSFFIPDEYKENYRDEFGIVLSIGPGYYDKKGKFNPTTLQEGSLVVYDRDVPWLVEVEGVESGYPLIWFSSKLNTPSLKLYPTARWNMRFYEKLLKKLIIEWSGNPGILWVIIEVI